MQKSVTLLGDDLCGLRLSYADGIRQADSALSENIVGCGDVVRLND